MEFTYENQGINTYLCCELTEMEIDTMGLGMITNNRIQGFVPSVFTQMNGRKFVKYNISSKVTMKQFFSGQVKRKRLVSVLAGIADLLMQAEEYMLDINSIILDTDYIYINVPDCTAEVIYVPAVPGSGGSRDAAVFFKNIMFSTQFDSTEDCGYVAEIINFLNQAESFSVPQFKKLLEKHKRQRPERAGIMQTTGSEDMGAVYAHSGNKEDGKLPGRIAEAGGNLRDVPEDPYQQPEKAVQEAVKAPASGIPVPKIPGGHDAFHIPQKEKGIPAQDPPKKRMSLFYLLQHYNKQNLEIYKAQRKKRKQELEELSDKKEKPQKVKAKKNKNGDAPVSYAIPGQQNALAVTGQRDNSAVTGQQEISAFPGQRDTSAVSTEQTVKLPVSRQEQADVSLEVKPAAVPLEELHAASNDNFGETEYMSPEDDGGTVLMEDSETQKMRPYLIRLRNNERIPLEKELLSIGRSRELVDYAIPDNNFVGHYHCHILLRDGEIFIVDDNSKNHTYVNGAEIQSNTEIKLSHNMIFSVADEEFEVRLF